MRILRTRVSYHAVLSLKYRSAFKSMIKCPDIKDENTDQGRRGREQRNESSCIVSRTVIIKISMCVQSINKQTCIVSNWTGYSIVERVRQGRAWERRDTGKHETQTPVTSPCSATNKMSICIKNRSINGRMARDAR